MTHNLNDVVKTIGDVVAGLVAGATVLTVLLPPIAALLTIIWTGIRIYDWYKGKKNGD